MSKNETITPQLSFLSATKPQLSDLLSYLFCTVVEQTKVKDKCNAVERAEKGALCLVRSDPSKRDAYRFFVVILFNTRSPEASSMSNSAPNTTMPPRTLTQ